MTKVRRKGTITSGGAVTSVISGKPIIKPDGSVSLLQNAELEVTLNILFNIGGIQK